jgi:hypothetical protein
MVAGNAQRANNETAAPEERCDDADHAWSDLFKPLARKSCGEA